MPRHVGNLSDPAFAELLLESASLPARERLVAGCERHPPPSGGTRASGSSSSHTIDYRRSVGWIHLPEGRVPLDFYDRPIKRRRTQASPPQPRLVGIETNPGPPRTLAKGLGDIGALIGAAVAKATKKAKKTSRATKRKKRVENGGDYLPLQASTRLVTAPSAVGSVTSRSSRRHSPFIVQGNDLAAVVGVQGSGIPYIQAANGGQTLLNSSDSFDMDIMSFSASTTNFAFFQINLRNLAANFTRYRFRRLIARWIPNVSSSVAQSFSIGTCPEVVTSSNFFGYANTTTLETSKQFSVWTPASYDLLGPGGLRTDWLYVDAVSSSNQQALRQESAGSFFFSPLALSGQAVSTLYGTVTFDFAIEFDGLALEASVQARKNLLAQSLLPVRSCSLSSDSAYEMPHGIDSKDPAA